MKAILIFLFSLCMLVPFQKASADNIFRDTRVFVLFKPSARQGPLTVPQEGAFRFFPDPVAGNEEYELPPACHKKGDASVWRKRVRCREKQGEKAGKKKRIPGIGDKKCRPRSR